MAGGGGGDSSRSLDQTATWAVAVVCTVLIIVSIVIEKTFHKLGTWLTNRHKNAMFEALEKVKAELMILGFISLILVFGQYQIPGICIPSHVANTMLPCPVADKKTEEEEHNQRLLWYEHRVLAAGTALKCKEGMVSLISAEGLHQLHILVFFLAVFHVFYSATTMWLGKLKIRGWKHWENETASLDYKVSNDPLRFRLAHETSFVRAHTSFWTRIPIFFYIGCFFRQFFRSVTKSDYLTLRNGFISVHLAPGSNFNFQKYIKRSLEDDFKLVVGVSPVLWVSFVVVVLLNVSGWNALRWAHFIPLLIILAVGTKLQAILTKMALEISDTQTVVQGIPRVRVSDKYFWFGCPQLVLHLIHFSLFQNAFLMTYFLWMSYEFGHESCFNEKRVFVILKFASGGGTLFLCSYITLPLYALVTQMGSHMKKSVFDEEMFRALKNWHESAVNDKRKLGTRSKSSLQGGGNNPVASSVSSGLHRFKTFAARAHPYDDDRDDLKNDMSSMPLASKGASTHSYPYDDDDENDDLKNDLSSSSKDAIIQVDGDYNEVEMCCVDHGGQEIKNEDEFEFSKPAAFQR